MARRKRRLEQIPVMGGVPRGLLELSQAIDQYVSFFVRGVQLFTDAHDQGLADHVLAVNARMLSTKMLAQAPVFDAHVARWEKEPLAPESRSELARLARQLARCRILAQTLRDIADDMSRPTPRPRPLNMAVKRFV